MIDISREVESLKEPIMRPKAALVIIGNEVLEGEVQDQNTPLLLDHLSQSGCSVIEVSIIADDARIVSHTLKRYIPQADWVIVTGGIGPTHDDCTRASVADALGLPLVRHEEALTLLDRLSRGTLVDSEKAMADLPAGAALITPGNLGGFGFRIQNVAVFPGVPRLLRNLIEANPDLFSGIPQVKREVTARLREGMVADGLRQLDKDFPEVSFGSYPEFDEKGWWLRLVLRATNAEEADRAEEALRRLVNNL